MDEETFNISMRKFLKTVGVGSQNAIEKAVEKAITDGDIIGTDFPCKGNAGNRRRKVEHHF